MVDTFSATCIKKRYPFLNSSEDEETDTLQVTVTDGTNPVSGASVTIEEGTVLTDENGTASFSLEYGDYTCTVTCTGYESATESLSFRSNHKNFSITLTESGGGSDGVTITVLDNTNNDPVINAKVIVFDVDESIQEPIIPAITTDNNGQVAFNIIDGTYFLEIDSPNESSISYDTISEEVTFDENHRNLTYKLTRQ